MAFRKARRGLNESERIAEQLHSVAIHLLRKLRKEDEGSGLNAPRLSALSVIVFGSPVTLGDLATAEQVQPPTMSKIVNALEEQGLVIRSKADRDGRKTYLSATSAGRKLLLAGRERRVRTLAKEIGKLAGKEREVLEGAAEILKRTIERL